MSLAKEYKNEIETLQKDKDLIARKLGETITEKYIFRSKGPKTFVDTKLPISLNKQCKLLNISKSSLYYLPVQKFSSDANITYLKLEKWHVYLAAIIDWNTKKILSWKLSNTMDVSLTTSVLNEALSLYPKPDIVNTDQGSQYTASAHVDILKKHNIQISMDGKGRSIDNIVIERFWRSLKYEEIYLNDYKSMGEIRYSIDNYINKYNTRRLHSATGNKTPNEVYFKAINNLNNKLLLKVS